MATRDIVTLIIGGWLIFAVAYMTRPVDPSINGDFYQTLKKAAPELDGLYVKEVEGVVTLPLDLGQIDIPQSELRLAAQEISDEQWFYIQQFVPTPRPKKQVKHNRSHDARVIDKQIKIAVRSVVKRKRRVRNKSRRATRNKKISKRGRSRKVARRNKKKVRARQRKSRVASFRKTRQRRSNTGVKTGVANTTRGYKKTLRVAFSKRD